MKRIANVLYKRNRDLLTVFLVFVASAAAQTSPWTLTTLYSFTGYPGTGTPSSGVAIGPGTVLYGTTLSGGASTACGRSGCGTVFSLTPPAAPGGAWTETIFSFPGGRGGFHPVGGVAIGSRGVLYGTTDYGGASDYGTVFSLSPPASPGGSATERVLHEFSGSPSDGANPVAGVVIGSGGVIYGTTEFGGPSGTGMVFSLTPPAAPGGGWTETVLFSGNRPVGVAIGSGGVLYGATQFGGTSGNGTVFSLTPPASPGGTWTETVLYNFSGGSDGGTPFAGVVVGAGGVLYGTTGYGGTEDNYGTVFSLTPPASPGGTWTETVLHTFAGGSDGSNPPAGVAIGDGGVLYGVTSGTHFFPNNVFSLTPPAAPGGAWIETVLYSFTSYNDDISPSGVAIGAGGVLYDTTEQGGTSNQGTVFSLTP